MRIPVSVIVDQIAHGASTDEILKGYPDLQPEDVREALEYAAWLKKEEVVPWKLTSSEGASSMQFLADMCSVILFRLKNTRTSNVLERLSAVIEGFGGPLEKGAIITVRRRDTIPRPLLPRWRGNR